MISEMKYGGKYNKILHFYTNNLFYQGKSTSFGITTKYNEEYRHDAEKRDFVACGSAAGVAAAFGSPSKISFFLK
jgi:hypothetical protein